MNEQKADKILKILELHKISLNIFNSYIKTVPKLESYKNIMAMISGGVVKTEKVAVLI